ncbi:dystrotelin [Chelmon rostratus]|uniref:dystrotelin n=1 Tax=Chelmon rostratus TaxID=109905 RepID=UPI001BEAF7B3|nr:dystrotelin [Chelmon rostratus]
MDLDSIEGLNEIRSSVYRVSMKLLSLQKLCRLDVVSVRHITAALDSADGAKLRQEVGLNRQEVIQTLNRMFHSISQEVPGHVTAEAPEETCGLVFRLYDRGFTQQQIRASDSEHAQCFTSHDSHRQQRAEKLPELQVQLCFLHSGAQSGACDYPDACMAPLILDNKPESGSRGGPGFPFLGTIHSRFNLRWGGAHLPAVSCSPRSAALVSVAENSSGSVSRSGLRSLLKDLSQVPAAVQEGGVFGGLEAAVKSCFNGVLTPTASVEHVLSWLQSEPRLLLWLPTLYRLSVTHNVSHNVRCHTCKTLPITGLRYRCMKCVNVHVCQSCFLTDRQTRKHKTHHPVLEFCTQPTWRESLSSLVHSARHALLPRRHTQREADNRRVMMWAGPGENRAPPPSDPSTQLATSAVSHSPCSDRNVSRGASVRPPPCSYSSKALQTDEETPPQQRKESTLLTEVRNLQRDKWLLEQQLQAWRVTVQSEQGMLEDRCSEMEVTMETMREHNLCLQGMLTQALNKMEARQHADKRPQKQQNGAEGAGSQEENCLSEEEDCDRKRAELLEAADQVGDSIHHLVDTVRTNTDDQVTHSQVIKAVYST